MYESLTAWRVVCDVRCRDEGDLIFLQKEPREPIYLYEPAVQVNGPPDMGFQPPFRGGRGGGGGPMGRGGPPFMGRGGRGGGRGVSFCKVSLGGC